MVLINDLDDSIHLFFSREITCARVSVRTCVHCKWIELDIAWNSLSLIAFYWNMLKWSYQKSTIQIISMVFNIIGENVLIFFQNASKEHKLYAHRRCVLQPNAMLQKNCVLDPYCDAHSNALWALHNTLNMYVMYKFSLGLACLSYLVHSQK